MSSLDLSDAAIVSIGHVGVEGDVLFYSMPLADQTEEGSPVTLALRIESGGPLPPRESLDLVERLLVGLRTLHDADLVHRDIKPANVLCINGEWMVGDIGLVAPERTEMTAVGTADFQPPWGPIDRRADTYAIGRLLYCAFTGLSARSFPTLPSELLSPERRRSTRVLNELVVKACDPNPDRRFQTADEMLDAVRSAQLALGGSGGVLTRRRVLVAAGTSAAGLALGSFLWPRLSNGSRSAASWQPLFDGRTLDGWYVPSPEQHGPWHADGGTLQAVRNDHFKSIHTVATVEAGRFRAVVVPDHSRARLGITYGHPSGCHFLFYEDKYVWIRNYKDPDAPEEPGRWRSFPGRVLSTAGESILMEVEIGRRDCRLFVDGELLQTVDGITSPGQLGLHVWAGDGGRFRDIEFQPKA